MPRDQDALLIRKWAGASALVQTPEAAGLVRATGLPAAYGVDQFLTLEVFNQLWRELTGAAVEVAQRGILEWDTAQRYEHPSWVTGSNGTLYRSVQASGGSDPSQNPTADTSETYWAAFAVSVPSSSTTARGLIRTSTLAEALAGTGTSPAVTPAGLSAAIEARVEALANAAVAAAAPPTGAGEQRYPNPGTYTFTWPWSATEARVVVQGGGGGGGGGRGVPSATDPERGSNGLASSVAFSGSTEQGAGGFGGYAPDDALGAANASVDDRTAQGNGGQGGNDNQDGRNAGFAGRAGVVVVAQLTGLSVGDQIAVTVGAGGAGGAGGVHQFPGNNGDPGTGGTAGHVTIVPVY